MKLAGYHSIKMLFLRGLLIISYAGIASAGDYDSFKAPVRTAYDPSIVSIIQAIDYLVGPTGYQITTSFPAPVESRAILLQALSPNARTNHVVTIEEAMLEVVGEDNKLIIDHEHKLISVGRYDEASE